MRGQLIIATAATGTTLLVASAASAQVAYQVGDSWHRATDWTPGFMPGSTEGNPSPDFLGQPVWQYEVASGGEGLGSASPWYTQPSELLTWDNDWWATGQTAWTAGDDTNPPVFQDRMTHHIAGRIYDDTPLVRWMMPSADPLKVSITGDMGVLWTGEGGVGSDIDVELVIARDNGDGTHDVIFSDTLSKPTPGDSVGDRMSADVSLSDVLLSSDDSLVISGRAVKGSGTLGRWMAISDDLTIEVTEVVPAPASLALLGLGGLAAARRRR